MPCDYTATISPFAPSSHHRLMSQNRSYLSRLLQNRSYLARLLQNRSCLACRPNACSNNCLLNSLHTSSLSRRLVESLLHRARHKCKSMQWLSQLWRAIVQPKTILLRGTVAIAEPSRRQDDGQV